MEAKKRKLLLTSMFAMLLVLGMCLGGRVIIRNLTISPLRRALPSTAEEIHEWQWSERGLIGQDYVYMLSAKITEQQFLKYVDKLDMTPHTPEREYSRGFALDWYPHELLTNETLEWWTPSRGHDGTYASDGESWWEYVKWENGYLYVVSYSN